MSNNKEFDMLFSKDGKKYRDVHSTPRIRFKVYYTSII